MIDCKINGSHKWVWSDITKNELTCEKCGKKSKEQWQISVMKAMNKTAKKLVTDAGTQTADSNTEDYLYVSTPMSNVMPPSSNKSLNGSSKKISLDIKGLFEFLFDFIPGLFFVLGALMGVMKDFTVATYMIVMACYLLLTRKIMKDKEKNV